MSSSQTPSPPSHNATPLEVRDYFAGVLFNFHDVSLEQAHEIAAKWEYGRGSELTYYDVATFRSIFGAEAGTLLYGYARKELRTSRTGPSGNLGNRGILEKPQNDIFGATPGFATYLSSAVHIPGLFLRMYIALTNHVQTV
ncbi:hypothetical protein V501_06121 [Pseudogymnoascus sp. VKM F-4519 (FW-2642)]|nr:hypothetical protein V501_06121 [Pseudogymnoascus sp. VKM F-4519 (FW-2642)]